MKLPSKLIVLLVILSLTGIFAYQTYWLTRLYRTMYVDMEKDITEAMRISDYNEMMMRVEKLRNDRINRGSVDVSAGYDNEKTYVRSSTNLSNDSLDFPHASMKVHKGMDVVLKEHSGMQKLTNYLQQGLHAGLDILTDPVPATYDSLLVNMLHEQGINVPYRLEYLYQGGGKTSALPFTDTLFVRKTEGYTPSPQAVQYEYAFNLHGSQLYRLTIEPITPLVLKQMSGILATSFIILLILAFSFWFLIRTIWKQKTLEEMKSDFTNNITHELKTPIAVAYAANDALLNFNQAEEKTQRDKYLRICQEQLRRLSGLVEQILSMSMERRKTFRLQPEELSLQELTEQLAEQHRLKADKPVRISIDIEPKELTLLADRTHFSNILSNLIDNAIKYSPEKAEIRIHCRKITPEGKGKEQIEISVTDHGIGIAPDKQKHIFEKFYRVPTGNLHDVKGYGLGLFYVKTLIEKHEGTVWVKSEVGKGSTFTIRL